MTPHARTVERQHAGRAHAAIYPSRKGSAATFKHHLATEYTWVHAGPPALARYAILAPDKWRFAAHMNTLAYAETIAKWTPAKCVERFTELRKELALAEAHIEVLEADGVSQGEIAGAEEHVSALRAERAAIRLRFEKERMTPAQIRGDGRGH
jgi:hypothetical protein